jgi:hypothetical protein
LVIFIESLLSWLWDKGRSCRAIRRLTCSIGAGSNRDT